MRRVVLFFVVAFLATAVEAAPPTTSRVVATPIPEAAAVKVDGELNDAIWQTVPPIKEFVQREPKEGAAPTFETEARVAYDATALYIAVIAFDSDPKRIVGIRTRRDEGSPSDWISVVDRHSSSTSTPPASNRTATGSTTRTTIRGGMRSGTPRSHAPIGAGVPSSGFRSPSSGIGQRRHRRSVWRSSGRSGG